MDKYELRKKYLEIRKGIVDTKEKSQKIENSVINNEKYKRAQVIALYKALSLMKNVIDLGLEKVTMIDF